MASCTRVRLHSQFSSLNVYTYRRPHHIAHHPTNNFSPSRQLYYRRIVASSAAQLIKSTRYSSSSTPKAMSVAQLKALEGYSACDVADALLKLEETESGQRPTAGFLEGIVPLLSSYTPKMVIGPAFTVQFQPKDPSLSPPSEPQASTKNIPSGSQWSDLVESGSIVVVQQPEGQKNAAVGGIHALRMNVLGAKGLLVSGWVRDKAEMGALELQVWSKGTSIVGAGAECKPWAVQVPVRVGEVNINPGDLIMCDPAEGAVRIPAALVGPSLKYLEEHFEGEESIKRAVKEGVTVGDAFKKYRG